MAKAEDCSGFLFLAYLPIKDPSSSMPGQGGTKHGHMHKHRHSTLKGRGELGYFTFFGGGWTN